MTERDPVAAQYREMAYASHEAWIIRMWDDMNLQLSRKSQEIERLRAGLIGHACLCGSSDLEPAAHSKGCAYRKWASPEPQTPPQNEG
jgi:hypothetical protein